MELIETQAGAPQGEIKKLRQSVLDLAKGSVQGPIALAKALFFVESAGFRGAKAMDILDLASKGAMVGQADLEEVTYALTAAMKTGIKGTESSTKAMGALNAIVGQGQMKMGDLTAALSTGIIPAAKRVGLTLADVGGALDVMTARGIPAQQAATRLGMAFLKMIPIGDTAVTAFESMGLGQFDLANKMSGPGGLPSAIELLRTKYDAMVQKVGKNEATKAFLTMFPRGMAKTIGLLMDSYTELGQKTDAIRQKSTDFPKAVRQAAEGSEDAIRRAWSSIRVSLIEVGDVVAPIAAKIASGIASIATKFGQLSPHTQKIILMGLAFVALIGPIMRVAGAVIALGRAMAVTTLFMSKNPLFAAVALAGVAIAYGQTQRLIGAFREMPNPIRAAKAAVDALTGSLDRLKQANLNVAQAQIRVKSAALEMKTANQAWQKAISDGKAKTDEGVAAQLRYKQALLDLKQAQIDLNTAQRENSKAHATRQGEISATINSLGAMTKEMSKLAMAEHGTWKVIVPFGQYLDGAFKKSLDPAKIVEFGHKLFDLGEETLKTSYKLEKLDPVGALAQRVLGSLEKTAGVLTLTLRRIPTKKEIIAEAKLRGGALFQFEIDTLIKKSKAAGIEIPAWLAKAASPAEAAMRNVGKKATAGLVAGLSLMSRAAREGGATAAAAASPSVPKIISGIAGALTAGTGKVNTAAAALGGAISTKLNEKARAAREPLRLGILGAIEGLGPLKNNAGVMGGAIGASMKGGILRGLGGLADAVAGMVSRGIRAGIDAGNQRVGSTAYEYARDAVGKTIGKGVVDGAVRELQKLGAAMSKQLRAALQKASQEVWATTAKLNAIRNRQSTQDLKWAVESTRLAITQARESGDAAVAEARKAGKGVEKAVTERNRAIVEAQRQFTRATEAITTAALEKKLVVEQKAHDRAQKALEKAMEKQKKAMDKALAKQKAAVEKARSVMTTAWDRIAAKALSAFDAATGAFVSPAQKQIDSIRARRDAEDSADAITDADRSVLDAHREVTEATEELAKAQAALLAPAEDANIADLQKSITEAQRRIDSANLAVISAERTAARAREDVQLLALEVEAENQRTAWEQERAELREHLDRRLALLIEKLSKEGATWDTAMTEITTLLGEYGVSFEASGVLLGMMFAEGFKAAAAEAAAAAQALLDILAQVNSAVGGGYNAQAPQTGPGIRDPGGREGPQRVSRIPVSQTISTAPTSTSFATTGRSSGLVSVQGDLVVQRQEDADLVASLLSRKIAMGTLAV